MREPRKTLIVDDSKPLRRLLTARLKQDAGDEDLGPGPSITADLLLVDLHSPDGGEFVGTDRDRHPSTGGS